MVQFSSRKVGLRWRITRRQEQKKADVVEHPKAFDHVGLLFNKPLGTAELLFI
jgi:hypothetical protein